MDGFALDRSSPQRPWRLSVPRPTYDGGPGPTRPCSRLQRQGWGRSDVRVRNDFAIGNYVVHLLFHSP